MLHNLPWNVDSCSAGQEIPCPLRRLPIYYSVHNSIQLDNILSQLNTVYTPHPILLRSISILSSHLYLGLPRYIATFYFPIKIVSAFLILPRVLLCCFLGWVTLKPWRWRRHIPPKRRLTSNGLHSVISQKTELFIITAVRTSNPKHQMKITDYEHPRYAVFSVFLLGYFLCLMSKYFTQHLVLKASSVCRSVFPSEWVCVIKLNNVEWKDDCEWCAKKAAMAYCKV
jgi:hypothetical protein